MLFSLLFSSIPNTNISFADQVDNSNRQSVDATEINIVEITKNKLENAYHISMEEIQLFLDKGYTLDEIEKGLAIQSKSGGTLSEKLAEVSPSYINLSQQVTSIIKSDLKKNYAKTAGLMSIVPDYNYVKTKPDEAPFSVPIGLETVSTLSGGISLSSTDLSLPGRNGLAFSLTRTYDSTSSQFNQMAVVGGTNSTLQPVEEKLFPIGKGWNWDLSYMEIAGQDKFVHIAGSGVYKIDASNKFVGYPWKDLTFELDSSVNVSNSPSAYVVKSIQKINQYFNAQGQLIQISDHYNNKITFHYTTHAIYGSVLSTIKDAIGNAINITYSSNAVVLSNGIQTVTYIKTSSNGKELLSQVLDPSGLATTYDYNLKDAYFNLVGTTPTISNPYALLSGITYPTGAKSIIDYETLPTTRYVGPAAVNQVFRVKSREDKITKVDASIETVNHKEITYPLRDIGYSYQTDYTFSVSINDQLTQTTFTNEKDFIDVETDSVLYNLQVNSTSVYGGKTYTKTTDYLYDRSRKWPVPITTTITQSESGISNTAVLVSSQSYNDYGNVTSSIDPMGLQTLYTYDATSHLLVGTSTPFSSTQTQYTELVRDPASGNITTKRIRDGSSTGTILNETINSNYDSYGNVTQTKFLRSTGVYTIVNTEYDATAPYLGAYPTKTITTVVDVDNNTSTIAQRYKYNAKNGALTNVIDGNNNELSYQYDILGRITKVINPDGSYNSVMYFDSTNEIEMLNETGIRSRSKWNPIGWKLDEGIVENSVYKAKVKNRYDMNGRIIEREDAVGNKMKLSYDQWSRENVITYPDLSTSSVVMDDINLTKSSIDQQGYILKEYYDLKGRTLIQEEIKKIGEGPATQKSTLASFTYDYVGNLLSVSDYLVQQNTTSYSYNLLGQLKNVVNANNETTSYQYDMLGNLLQTNFPDGKTKINVYDEIGRLIKTTDANNKNEKLYYDANNNQTKMVDRNGNRFKYSFDNRNLLKKKEITDASWNAIPLEEVISYNYNLAGQPTQMIDNTGTTSYFYNKANGLLDTLTYPDGKTIIYGYDVAGKRSVMNDPFGYNTYYHYDAQNRLDIVAPSNDFITNPSTTDYEARYQYNKNGSLKQITQKNGVTTYYGYDGNKLSSLIEKKSDGTILNSFTYSLYDNNGNLKKKTENGKTSDFTYDKLNRISTSTQFNETYTYDSRGNRQSLSTNNPFDRSDSTNTYDKRDQLTKIEATNNVNVTYKYNGNGQLWERTENGQITRYYWDGDQIIAEGTIIGGSSTLKARYIRGNGLVAREDVLGKLYYVKNGHGDIVNLMDGSGLTSVNSYEYDIFGNTVSRSEMIEQPFMYSGELTDNTTGLQYLRARWYDPTIGRFINEDTNEGDITNPLSLNLYTYVHNDPLRFIDPSGNYCVSADGNNSHAGACSNLQTSYWFPDDGQMIIANGVLKGKIGNDGATRSYQRYEIKYNAWDAIKKPSVRNAGPITEKNKNTNNATFVELKELGATWNGYINKYQFNVNELGVYSNYRAYSNGIEFNFNNGDKFRVEFTFGNAEVGFYIQNGVLFVGAMVYGGTADFTLYSQVGDSDYYLAANLSVSILSYGAKLEYKNGVAKFHLGFGEGGVGAGIGIYHIK